MIMQTAIYWLCRALLSVLCTEVVPLRRLELLAKQQLLLVERGLAIAESINDFATYLETAKDDKQDFSALAPAFREYALTLYHVFTALEEIDNRAIILGNAVNDDNLPKKARYLYQELDALLDVMPPMGWDNPLVAKIAVSKKCHVVTCAKANDWALYPDHAWGCFNVYDQCWLEHVIENSASEEACTYIHPIQFVSRMNVPNYFYWACVQGVQPDENERALLADDLIRALIAVTTEEDKACDEDNSSAPLMEQWGPLFQCLPKDVLLPVAPVRNRETCHDVMAGKEQVANVQMMLMQSVTP